jgi:flagellar hook protein FlgE
MRVQGWNATSIDGETFINSSATVEDLVIPVGSKDPAQQTSQVFLASNLNKNTPVIPAGATDGQIQEGTWTVEYDIYDTFGGTHTLRIDFTRNADAENQWIGRWRSTPRTRTRFRRRSASTVLTLPMAKPSFSSFQTTDDPLRPEPRGRALRAGYDPRWM